jgi:hypothetical protein
MSAASVAYVRGLRIYLLRAGQSVKIGVSRSVPKRVAQLQSASAQKIEIVNSWPTQRAYEVERYVHQVLGDYRDHGEWFNLQPQIAAMTIEEAIKRQTRNSATLLKPMMLLVCARCTHGAITPIVDAGKKLVCSRCKEKSKIKKHHF